MNRACKLSLASFASVLALSLASTSAFAAENEPAPAPAPAAAAPTADRSTDQPAPKPFKSFAVELNPLAAAIGRYSLQAEWLPAEHHAIVVNPHFDHVSADVSQSLNGTSLSYSESFTGFGGELGYRFYTGSKGANGFFAGPSIVVAKYSTSIGDQSGSSFTSVGGAFDVGGQWIIGPGVVVGFGAGLQYTSVSLDGSTDGLPLTAAIIAGGGVRPRALMTVGYAF